MYSLSEVDRSSLLLTGFPAAFVRSPDCTIWRSLGATSEYRKPPERGMNSTVVVCETGTLLVGATRWSIQGQTPGLGRVSYIGLTAATQASRCTKRDQQSKRFRSLQTRPEIRRPHEQNSISVSVGCPTDKHNWNVILPQWGKLNGSPRGGQKT